MQFLSTFLLRLRRLFFSLQRSPSPQKQPSVSMPDTPKPSMKLSVVSTPTCRTTPRRKDHKLSDEKQVKPHGFLSLDLLKSIDDWRRFIESIPGKTFDGVEIGAASVADARGGKIEIIAAYGRSGDSRKRYSAEMREEIQAIVAAQSDNVTSLAS